MMQSLTTHLWQSTFFALAVALLSVAFRKNRAHVRYWLWLSASLKFFIPFALLLNVGRYFETLIPAARQIATPAVSYTIEQFSGPFFPDSLPSSVPAPDTVHWIPIAILTLWLCGFAIVALIRFRNWLRVRAAVRASTATDISATVEVRVSPGLLEPGVVGLLRPILLLPEGIAERLTPAELNAVLAHELCHIRRRDNLFAALHMMAEAIFWFHPLVWWIGARLIDERERACDEEVLSQGNRPEVYADAILNVCKLYVESPLACVSGVSGASIRRRIETIMSNRRLQGLNRAKKLLLTAAGVVTVAGPIAIGLLIGAGNARVIHAQSPSARPAQEPPAPAAPVQAEQPRSSPPSLRFDAASIKPCSPNDTPAGGGRGGGGGGAALDTSPGRLRVTCMTVAQLIGVANGLFPFDGDLFRGGPAWVRADRYTVEASTENPLANGPAEGNTPASKALKAMLQTLLEDRLHLKIHRATEEIPVYALTVAKTGLKLKPTEPGACSEPEPNAPPHLPAPGEKPECHSISNGANGPNAKNGWNAPNWSFDYVGVSLGEFAAQIGANLDHRVIDRTGVTDLFSFHVEFARDENTPGPTLPGGEAMFAPPAPESRGVVPGPSIFTALEQQLGLKLESAKGPRGFIVIDSVERPSEN